MINCRWSYLDWWLSWQQTSWGVDPWRWLGVGEHHYHHHYHHYHHHHHHHQVWIHGGGWVWGSGGPVATNPDFFMDKVGRIGGCLWGEDEMSIKLMQKWHRPVLRVLCTWGSTIGWELSASQLLRGRPGATKGLEIRLRELEILLWKEDVLHIMIFWLGRWSKTDTKSAIPPWGCELHFPTKTC